MLRRGLINRGYVYYSDNSTIKLIYGVEIVIYKFFDIKI
jgi:hypothetical protein